MKAEQVKKAAQEVRKQTKVDDVDRVFGREKLPVKRVGMGVHNNVFYYGTVGIDGQQIVVTSDKKFYTIRAEVKEGPRGGKEIVYHDDIKKKFGLNYRFPMEEGLISHPWSNKAILKFLKGEYEPINIRVVFEKIVELNKRYLDHYDPRTHPVVACDIIADYANSLFESRGITHLTGNPGSGKTKQGRVYRNSSCNALWSSKLTPAAAFRAMEANCGRLCADNFDKLPQETKDLYSLFFQTGWEYDGVSHLVNKDTGKVDAYQTFSPIMVNNILGLDAVTTTRTIPIKMLKTTDKKIGKEKPRARDPVWEGIRNSLRYWVLDNWQIIEQKINEVEFDLDNRDFDVGLAVLVIAKIIGKDVFDDVLGYLKDMLAREAIRDISSDWEAIMFTELLNEFNEKEEQKKIVIAEFVEKIMPKLRPDVPEEILQPSGAVKNKDYPKTLKMMKQWAPKAFNRVPLFKDKSRLHGKLQISFLKSDVQKYITLMEYDQDIEEIGKKEKQNQQVENTNGQKQDTALPTPTQHTHLNPALTFTQGVGKKLGKAQKNCPPPNKNDSKSEQKTSQGGAGRQGGAYPTVEHNRPKKEAGLPLDTGLGEKNALPNFGQNFNDKVLSLIPRSGNGNGIKFGDLEQKIVNSEFKEQYFKLSDAIEELKEEKKLREDSPGILTRA
jgi:hypothetical protein